MAGLTTHHETSLFNFNIEECMDPNDGFKITLS